jgi:hypothetical protein
VTTLLGNPHAPGHGRKPEAQARQRLMAAPSASDLKALDILTLQK